MKVPVVTVDDMRDFHAKHFPSAPAPASFFSHQQTWSDGDIRAADKEPVVEEVAGGEQPKHDDDLGYYPDGVKRTLTDDEVSIFRHSEVHRIYTQLLEHASEAAERRLDALEAQEGLSAPAAEDEYVLLPRKEPEASGVKSDSEDEEEKTIRQQQAEIAEKITELTREQLSLQRKNISKLEVAKKKSAKKEKKNQPKKATVNVERGEVKQEVLQEVTKEVEHTATQEVKHPKNKHQESEAKQSPPLSNNENTRNNGPKKRKRNDEVDHHTYRRIAREMDDVKTVDVELDY